MGRRWGQIECLRGVRDSENLRGVRRGRRPNRPEGGFGGRSPPAPAEPGRPAAVCCGGQGAAKPQEGVFAGVRDSENLREVRRGRRSNRPPGGFGGRSPPAPAEPGRPAAVCCGGQGAAKPQEGVFAGVRDSENLREVRRGRRSNRPPGGFGGRSPPAPAEPGRPAAVCCGGRGAAKPQEGVFAGDGIVKTCGGAQGPQAKPPGGRFRRAPPAGPGGAGAACGPVPGPCGGYSSLAETCQYLRSRLRNWMASATWFGPIISLPARSAMVRATRSRRS